MRLFTVLFVLLPLASAADEIDLRPRSRTALHPPTWVIRAEGGNAYAPYGYTGACVSYMTGGFELEFGGGAGFPGLQLGLAARSLIGQRGSYFVTELALAGNTRVNRGLENKDPGISVQATTAKSSLWSSLGLGFEQRAGGFSLSAVGGLALTTASFTPHFVIHGGIGFGF